ncbi:ABC transporter substrate-binding protein [Limobrevibacterium gyesilva]|uniref:ABC transporter substrate-binding protein n=1 Tax=Limobrevibacterium gyesilva TaxID=2991712 RepID=UPI0038CF7147
MGRRTFLGAGAAALAAPHIVAAEATRVLKMIPQIDLTVFDPVWTSSYATRNHGMMVFDTLYGMDEHYRIWPQMVAGHTVEDAGKTWRLTLRPGLNFHDGTPVLARDCVASINRWGKRDSLGQTLMALTDELSAADDRTIVFRLKKPFALLPGALGKPSSNICAIMPERLAKTDPFTAVTEMVGSGPFRFKASELLSGSRIVYERNTDYVPRDQGVPSFTSGPKIVHFDRVEWHVINDAATAANALLKGEVDWWEQTSPDLLPLLRSNKGLKVEIQDRTGNIGLMRPNFLHPPFDNPAIRRALWSVIDQKDFSVAGGGADPLLTRVPVGVFCPGTPMDSDVGMDLLTGPRDYDRARRDLQAAGYKGEKVVMLQATDATLNNAFANVAADMLKKIGMNVELQASDWGTLVTRRAKKDRPDQGGWNIFFTSFAGMDLFNPATDPLVRGNGTAGWFGWPTMPALERLRDAWLDAPDLAGQQKIAREIQAEVFREVPYYPLGQILIPTAYKTDLTGMLNGGYVISWNVKRA